MDTAQGWTLIVGFFAIVVAGFGWQARLFKAQLGQTVAEIRDALHTEVGGLRVEFAELRGELRARMTNLEDGR